MANRADIAAGQAYVKLALRDNEYHDGLARAKSAAVKFAANIKAAFMAAVGVIGAIGAAVASAVTSFVTAGSDFNDMSARTGASAEQLQHWTYAAKQTGASAEDLEKALRSAAKNGVGPGQFERVGQEIASIKDPAERSAKAMEMFGKSGTKLIPMFADLNALKAQSNALGPILTEDQVRTADALGDSFGALVEALKRIVQQIGAAFGPYLITALERTIGLITAAYDAATGRGTDFSGDLLDRLAQLRRMSMADFQQRGKLAVSNFRGGAGGSDDEDRRTDALSKQDDILKSIYAAEKRRASLVNEFATAEERYAAKLKEINGAIAEVNRNRVLGFISPEQAAAERRSLEIARMRAELAERERRSRGIGKAGAAEKPERPDWAFDVVKRAAEISTVGGFNPNGLLLANQQGGNGPGAEQLKLAKQAITKYDRMIALLEGLNRKPPGMRVGD